MATTIETPYGSSFNARDLLDHIQGNDRTYIIQGQKVCSFINHKNQTLWTIGCVRTLPITRTRNKPKM